jgi:hypothetical protein
MVSGSLCWSQKKLLVSLGFDDDDGDGDDDDGVGIQNC